MRGVLVLLALALLGNDATGAAAIILPPEQVQRVHLVFSHHLDIGLDLPLKLTAGCVGFATSIVNRYFHQHIPRAMRIANQMRDQKRPERMRYQVHAWIADLYTSCVPWRVNDGCWLNPGTVRCPTASEVDQFDAAVMRGDIVFTGSPFNVNPEAVGDPHVFASFAVSRLKLDERYNRTNSTRTWSNVDVKGFARSSIAPLLGAGYTALYVGANGGPRPPSEAVHRGLQPVVGQSNATIFRWCSSNRCIPVFWVDGYGGYETTDACVVSPNGVAMASYFRSDNAGPPMSVEEVLGVYRVLRTNFPNAQVFASSIDAFASDALTPDVILQLPTTNIDWGDQWITGLSTDPKRLATFRTMVRAFGECLWSGMCSPSDPAIRNATRFLAKNIEHTQGVQGEDWSPGIAGPFQKLLADTSHWSNEEFAKVHNAEHNKFAMGDLSWIESRKFNELALEALEGHPLATDIHSRLESLVASKPSIAGLRHITDVATPLKCGNLTMAFNRSTGAVAQLAGLAEHSSPLFAIEYTTYNTKELWDTKKNLTCSEPGCPNPEDRVWVPALAGLWANTTASSTGQEQACAVVAHLKFDAELHQKYGAPLSIYVEYTLRGTGSLSVDARVTAMNKSVTRLPESLTIKFGVPMPGIGSQYDVLGEWVGPEEVGAGTTNVLQRGIGRGVRFGPLGDAEGQKLGHRWMVITSLDAGLAMPIVPGLDLLGDVSPMGEGTVPRAPLTGVTGTAFSLVQNLMPISGFPQWYPFGVGDSAQQGDENMVFRFSLSFDRI